jgi:hypothetical protein
MAVLGMECRDKPGWLGEFAEHPPEGRGSHRTRGIGGKG